MKFLTRAEVATYLRVHERTIERWLRTGALVGHKLGTGKTSLWRIPEDEVKKFLERSKNKKK
ncbi:MAG: helix-turn-helix domain-containing protein [Patescibacteria group bacterium]